jgi:hypothetical protein
MSTAVRIALDERFFVRSISVFMVKSSYCSFDEDNIAYLNEEVNKIRTVLDILGYSGMVYVERLSNLLHHTSLHAVQV